MSKTGQVVSMMSNNSKTTTMNSINFNRKSILLTTFTLAVALTLYLIGSMASWGTSLGATLEVAADSATSNEAKTVLVLGDSLSAGYQLPHDAAFPEQLAVHFKTTDHNITVMNAGVSGDTTADGFARLEWVLPQDPSKTIDLVILELGGNDVLRGLEPKLTKENLHKIILFLKAKKIPVLLAGMMSPPSMGREYETEFNQIYPDLAKEHAIPLYPFFLEGVANHPELLLSDGLHPTRAGVAIMVKNISPFVLKALQNPK